MKREADDSDLKFDVAAAINGLPHKKAVAIRRLWEGMTKREIAVELGVTERRVSQILQEVRSSFEGVL